MSREERHAYLTPPPPRKCNPISRAWSCFVSGLRRLGTGLSLTALAASLLLAAAPVQAQTAVKLVGNTEQPRLGGAFYLKDIAQAFITGTDGQLTHVDIWMSGLTSALGYSVSIHSGTTATPEDVYLTTPGAHLATLANPASLPGSSGGLAQFTAPGNGIALTANTVYWVVVDIFSQSSSIRIGATKLRSEDSGAVAGWMIEDTSRQRDVGNDSWGSLVHLARSIDVYGYETEEGAPEQPDRPMLRAGDRRIVVSWSEPFDKFSAITGYDVAYCELPHAVPKYINHCEQDADWTDAGHVGTATIHTLTGLTNGVKYSVRVRAVNAHGPGPWSSNANATPTAPTVPEPPEGPATPTTVPTAPEMLALTPGAGEIEVTWTAPADDGGSAIADYTVQWTLAADTGFANRLGTVTVTDTTHRITGLANGTAYAVRVQASNAVGAVGAWSEATVETPVETVVSQAGLEVALSAVGRVVATDAVTAIGTRLAAPAGTASHATLGGVALRPGQWLAGRGATEAAPGPGNWATEPTGMDRAAQAAPAQQGRGSRLSLRDLLPGSAFHLSLTDATGPGAWSLWGQGAVSDFANRAGATSVDGQVVSGTVGTDWQVRETVLAGLAGTWSDGTLSYQDGNQRGDLDLTLTSVLPYVQWQPAAGWSLWGLGGVGFGDLAVHSEGQTTETDVSMRLAALGLRYALEEGAWGQWAVKADAFGVELDADGQALAGLPTATGDAQRVRLALQGRGQWAELTPNIEVGVRLDEGAAGSGGGVEVGGGVGYVNAALGLTVETRARVLVAHAADGFEEWGAGGLVRYDPGVQGAGFQVELAPQWGVTSSGVATLWNQVPAGPGAGLGPPAAAAGRLAAQIRYTSPGLTPFMTLALSGAEQRVGTGASLGLPALNLNLAVVAEQIAPRLGPMTHGIRLELGRRY